MSNLFQSLSRLAKEDVYPFHMPGHKRNMSGYMLQAAYQLDITEIEDFDNLHRPTGIIGQAQKKQPVYGEPEKAFFL